MFQSKLFRNMLLTYLVIVVSYMILCVAFLVYENSQISKIQNERQGELQLEEVENVFEKRIEAAENAVTTLKNSTTMRQLYLSVRTGSQMDSYRLSSIQTEMKSILSQGSQQIYKAVLFVNGSDRAYSSSGVIKLQEPFSDTDREFPVVTVSSISDVFSIESSRYSFQMEGMIYLDSYTYQRGLDIGTLCIVFDGRQLSKDIEAIMQDGYHVTIRMGDNVLYENGEAEGTLYSVESPSTEGLVYEVYADKNLTQEFSQYYIMMIAGVILISLFFAVLAYRQSRRYYKPIDYLEQNIETKPEETPMTPDEEMQQIIHGIENLIGEKNGYREKLLTISPYAKTGMLHSMISGSATDNVRVAYEENYLDLINPYYIVSIVNFAYEGIEPTEDDAHREKREEFFKKAVEQFSTDEINLVYYFRDIDNVFLITSFVEEEQTKDLFFRVHKFLSSAVEEELCVVTMGVDMMREDIGELNQACEGALKALDGILTDGRGMVYFSGDDEGRTSRYYFPPNFHERLREALKALDKEAVHELLFEVYKKNYDLSGTSEMYRSLIDELHLSIIKTLREMTELNSLHVSIEKFTGLATLQDIFDYYDAALISVIDNLESRTEQTEDDSRLRDDIVRYIDEHTFDPELSQQGVMDLFHVSNRYLSLLCKEKFGVTYLTYIQNRRIERAVELLEEGGHSLTEIATMCGYTSQLTFRRNFKKIMGVNPSDYMDQKENEEK